MKRSRWFLASAGRLPALLPVFGVIFISLAHAQVTFFTPPTYSGGGPDFVADYNGDGKPDILSGQRHEPGQWRRYLYQGGFGAWNSLGGGGFQRRRQA